MLKIKLKIRKPNKRILCIENRAMANTQFSVFALALFFDFVQENTLYGRIGKSAFDGKLIAYYGKERTKECWERWKRCDTE